MTPQHETTETPTPIRRRRAGRLLVGIAAVGLLAGACSDDGSAAETANSVAPTSSPAADSDELNATHAADHSDMEVALPSSDTPASDLRAGLTALLQEHVYLAGIAINQAVADGGDLEAPATAAAVAALDANSVDLAGAVGSVYGEAGGDQFLALWRDHIGFFVEYTLAGAGGDTEGQEAARDALNGYRSEFGAFLEAATDGGLPAEAVAEELIPHVDSVFAAIDSVLAGSPDVFADLRTAAGHMPHTAQVLAGAIIAQFPDTFAG